MPKREWEEKLAFYDGLIEEIPEFERKGKSMAYTSANGYMFSQLNKAGEIGIRLSKSRPGGICEKTRIESLPVIWRRDAGIHPCSG